MKLTTAIKNDFGRLKEISMRNFVIYVSVALLTAMYAFTRPALIKMTLSVFESATVFMIPFAAEFLFCTLIHRSERSVFWFTKWLFCTGVPFTLIQLASSIFDPNKARSYTDNFYSSFLPEWIALWLGGTALAYIILRCAGYALSRARKKSSPTARVVYALVAMYTPQKTISRERRDGKGKWAGAVICMVMIAIAVFIATVTLFLYTVYSNMEFEAILFTITFAAGGLAWEDLVAGFALTVLFSVVTGYLCFNLLKCFMNNRLVVKDSGSEGKYTLVMNSKKRALHMILSAGLLIVSAAWFSVQTHFIHYVDMKLQSSDIYDSSYVNPDESNVVFPEKKRNLIYIFLESIENTYASRDAGGSQDENYISELTELAGDKDSVNFSNTDRLGGASVFVPAISYTQGSTVAQTSGIALNTQITQFFKSPEYPKMTTLEDILHDNGYEQLYIEGSKGEFSLYDKYVGRYENSHVFDRITAAEQGYSDENADYIWKWGIEDRKLIDITKQLITDISKKDKPFFVTMYTMDTHTFECGHRCVNCNSSIENDYLASVDCTSRQISEFISWIKQQPFYENTTVILVGDHLGNQKTARVDIDEGYVRTTYNCIINPAKQPVNTKNRVFSSLDMFPTTLSAIGAEIRGDRLGLGTDLFSSTKTLCEELGEEEYKNQLERTSEYYKKVFFEK